MQSFLKSFLHAAVISSFFVGTAQAATVDVGLWRLGDDDGIATNGGSATTVGFGQAVVGNNLNLANSGSSNSQTYTNDTPSPLSTFATTFDNNDGYFTTTFSSAIDNFGIEVWAKPNNNTDAVGWLANNGLALSGWGIVQVGGAIKGHYSGVGDVGSATVEPDAWNHYALVRDGGIATLYVNGIAAGTSGATPNTPTGVLEIGYLHLGGVGDREWFDGALDHVRVFEFNAGEFDPTTDLTLLQVVPEPGSLVLTAIAFLGMGVCVRCRRHITT